MSKLFLKQISEGDKKLITLELQDPNATVADLLEVWQALCDDSEVYKKYALDNHKECKGCTENCCNTAYVIPDIIAFKKMADFFGEDYPVFIKKYFTEEKLNAGLLRMTANPCIFLKDGICQIYSIRSLICRFYICSDIAGDTEQLIYSITWAGSATTQLWAEQNNLVKKSSKVQMSSFDMLFQNLIEEYRYSELTQLFLEARDYSDIPLKAFIK